MNIKVCLSDLNRNLQTPAPPRERKPWQPIELILLALVVFLAMFILFIPAFFVALTLSDFHF